MKYICKYCNKELSSIRKLQEHEKVCQSNPNILFDSSSLQFNQKLYSHYYFLYKDKMMIFKNKKYLEYKNKGYNRINSLLLSKIDTLSYIIKYDEEIQINDGTWACPICGLHIKDMCAHIEKVHEMSWDEFVSKYEWKGTKIYFSDNYRKNLRQNKLNYYNNTIEGAKAKVLLSKKFSGQNNPACRDDVKLKISKSRTGQHMSLKNKQNISKSIIGGLYSDNSRSYGYTFWAFIGTKEVRFRSKCEYLIYLMFNYYNINVEHEPFKIEYFDPNVEYIRHYIVDYVHGNRLFEVKPKIVDFTSDIKYNLAQESLSKLNKKLEILTPNNFIDVLEIDYSIAKPTSFFEKLLINNIRTGECKMLFPIAHDIDFYKCSKFVKDIGGLEVIRQGELLYENKKSSRSSQ